jgi:putative SOS response-associated peptidase YedK
MLRSSLYMAQIHDRQPVTMRPAAWKTWLDTASSADDLLDAAADDAPKLAWHEVGNAVGSVRNNSPEWVEPAD